MRSAIVHDWLVVQAGAEGVLRRVLELYPSTVHALVHDPKAFEGSFLDGREVRTSFLQSLPRVERYYRSLLPLFPLAVEQFDLRGYDLVLSISHCAAKGVLTRPDQLHLSYCLTPVRYAWDLQEQYLEEAGLRGPKAWAARAVLHYIRMWDRASSDRVDHYATLSHYVARRIKRIYGRDAEVIYPPVDVERFKPAARRGDHFITVSRLVPYKKTALIARAFRKLGLKLLVVGDGPDREKVKAECGGPVEFVGRAGDRELEGLLSSARAFVFAAEEDFGIAPVEAQACGVPVVALGKGGAAETVVDGRTGVLFEEATEASLAEGVERFRSLEARLDPAEARENAARFSVERFKREFSAWVDGRLQAFHRRPVEERRPAP